MTSVGDGGGLNRRMTAIPAAHLRHGNSYSRMLDSDVAFVHPRVPNVASNSYEGNFMCSVVVFPSRFGSQTIRHACVTCIISRVIRRMNLGLVSSLSQGRSIFFFGRLSIIRGTL